MSLISRFNEGTNLKSFLTKYFDTLVVIVCRQYKVEQYTKMCKRNQIDNSWCSYFKFNDVIFLQKDK